MNKIEQLSEALRGSLVANEDLKRINRQLANAAREPIAILATACRLPGGVANAEALWELVANGVDAIGPLPSDRGWQLDELLQSRGETRVTPGMWQGGFLEDANAFDAAFFGISDREAMAMDPQHRLLLETTWEVIENAGILPGSLKKTSTGVFIGTTYQAYVPQIYDNAPELDGYRLQGGLSSMASGRVSYAFGLNGPAVTIDTACSSSLVAIHTAVQSLRGQECSLAIAGGATIVASPEVYVEFARQKGLAADGRCKAFAEAADGTAFSEGVGMVLLARLSDALRLGHPILAVIRGSAINHDGASNGLTAPNGPAQEKVIAKALKNAGLTTADIDIVEAHGTGTSLGDPIEANALINTYGQKRPEGRPLWLGSLKSNVGHVQAASGVVGMIKMVMALKHSVMPRTLHADLPSSKIEWSAGAVSLIHEARPWPETESPRRAAVSSFGFSGTNCHMILEQAPAQNQEVATQAPVAQPVDFPLILPVSGTTSSALKAQAAQLAEFLRRSAEDNLPSICAAMATTRTHFDHRAVCIGSSGSELVAALDGLSKGEAAGGLTQGVRIASETCAFLFSGQGSQWAGMGQQLYARLPAFARHLDRVVAAIDPHLAQPLQEIIFAEAGSPQAALLDRTDFTQPALFATEVALYHTLIELGVKPDYLCGHSIGEIAAAYVAGVFSLEDSAKFVVLRGRLMQEIAVPGAMLAIEATEGPVLETLANLEDRVSIGAINAPNSIVISGDLEEVLSLAESWKARGARTSRLNVSHAFHSPHIQTIVEELGKLAASITLNAPTIPIVSTVTGALLTDEEACSPSYWASQAKRAVRYADAISFLRGQEVLTYVEIGPDAVLATLAQSNLATLPQIEGRDVRTLALMRRNRNEVRVFTGALASLHVRGHALDWCQLGTVTRPVNLPTYVFQRKRFWYKPSLFKAGGTGQVQTEAAHPFLRPGIELADGQGQLFCGHISASGHEWLFDHAINGIAIHAGASTAELILTAGTSIGLTCVDNLVLLENLPLPRDGGSEIQLRVGEQTGASGAKVDVYFRQPVTLENGNDKPEGGVWRRHATARLIPAKSASSVWPDLMQWPPHQAEQVEYQSLYEKLEESGVHLGPSFQLITSAWRKGEDIYVEAEMPAAHEPSSHDQTRNPGFLIHPALLDAGLQASLLQATQAEGVRQLFSIGGLQVYRTDIRSIRACVHLTSDRSPQAGHSEHSVRISDQAGVPVAEIASVVLRAADQTEGRKRKHPVYRIEWATISPSTDKPAPAAYRISPDSVSNLSAALGVITAEPFALGVLCCDDAELLTTADTYGPMIRVMEIVQAWLAEPAAKALPLLVATRNAVETGGQWNVINLVQAPIWGLLRSVQREHPGRIVLLDLDAQTDIEAIMAVALAAAREGETELAMRNGKLLVARLAKHSQIQHSNGTLSDDIRSTRKPKGTVLITGAGSLGALVARRLARNKRFESIILASRRGPAAPGAAQLLVDLSALDIDIRIVKCDVSDHDDLSRLIRSIADDRPLKAVIHTAGVSEPVAFVDLRANDVEKVMRPKVQGTLALHELTKDMELDAFILFSSAVGVIGLKDQSHYGAANSFLDAIASYRRGLGLPATSLAWGIWDYGTEMGEQLGADRLDEVIRTGYRFIPADYGLDLVEAVLEPETGGIDALLIAAQFDLRKLAVASPTPLLENLIGRAPPHAPQNTFIAQYTALEEVKRSVFLLNTIIGFTCRVLRNSDPASVSADAEFRTLGFDSLTSIEMTAELSSLISLNLPATAVFDHPTPRALAAFLQKQLEVRKSTVVTAKSAADVTELEGGESLGHLMLTAIMHGRTAEGRRILTGAASFRQSFSSPLPREVSPRVTWLNNTGKAPLLVCINSFIPSIGDYTYRRLANALTGKFDVAAISLPGYAEDEPLPSDVAVLGEALAAAIQVSAGDRPYALAGFSTGGLAAYAAADHLEKSRSDLRSLILIDTFHPLVMTDEAIEAALSEWVRTAGNLISQSDAGLTAMAWYLDLFLKRWVPSRLEVPVCLIQAEDSLSGTSAESWAEAWGTLTDRVTVPGRHFTLLREDVAPTAAQVAKLSRANQSSSPLKDAV